MNACTTTTARDRGSTAGTLCLRNCDHCSSGAGVSHFISDIFRAEIGAEATG